jgi:bacterioferritin
MKGSSEVEGGQRANDPISHELMVKILADEEHHQDHLQTRLDPIEKIGIENYITCRL